MKISLIYPGIVRIGFNSLGKGGMNCNWINLGLAYIGAYLKKHLYTVDLIDLREMQNWVHFEYEIRCRDSDLYGVYFNTPNYNYAIECCKIIKKFKKIVVAGGPHASIAPEELLQTGFVDYVITGEGEISFLELIERLEKNSVNEKIIYGKPVENLNLLPFPDRDLYNIGKVIKPVGNFPFMDNGLVLITSRGCPYNCSFCQPLANKMFGKKIRYRSVENVIAELKYIADKYKVKYVSFQDDCFTTKKQWVLEFCKSIKKEKLSLMWSAQSRVNNFDEELAEAMSNSGCVCLFFGFESGSQRILNFLRKGINPEQSIKVADICKKYGILIFADYMLGIPTESEKDLKQTLLMIKKIRPEIHSPSFFTPIPGSDLYEYCKQNGLIKITTYENFTRNPDGEKIATVDYKLVEKYKLKMERYRPKWYQESHFAKVALKRWLYLLKTGYIKTAIYEFLEYSFVVHLGIVTFLRRIRTFFIK